MFRSFMTKVYVCLFLAIFVLLERNLTSLPTRNFEEHKKSKSLDESEKNN